MSRAFVKEEQAELPPQAPPRAALPEGVPNYVTPSGLARLRGELEALESERATLDALPEQQRARAASLLAQRKAMLEERIASAVVQAPPADREEVRFGACVTVKAPEGAERTYRIVGVDEAAPERKDVAFVSPVARALLGRRAGEVTTVRTPRGEEELEIVAVRYP